MKTRYGSGRPSLNRRSPLSKILVVVVMLLVACGAVYYFWPQTQTQTSVAKTITLTYSQNQSIDVNTVGGAIGQYTAANHALPIRLSANGSTLVMCNSVCDPTTSQISQLVVYQAADVMIKSYTAGMMVPSKNDMLLVRAATCRSASTLGDETTKQNAMIILYATDSSTGLSQHCVTL